MGKPMLLNLGQGERGFELAFDHMAVDTGRGLAYTPFRHVNRPYCAGCVTGQSRNAIAHCPTTCQHSRYLPIPGQAIRSSPVNIIRTPIRECQNGRQGAVKFSRSLSAGLTPRVSPLMCLRAWSWGKSMLGLGAGCGTA